MRKALLILGFVLFAAALSAQIRKDEKIGIFGDTVIALGKQPGGCLDLYFDGMKANGTPLREVYGAGAWFTAKDFMPRFEQKILPGKPSVMLVNFGQSDILRNTPFELYEKSMRELIGRAQKEQIKVIMLTLFPLGEDPLEKSNAEVGRYNTFLKQLAKENNLELWDVNEAVCREIAIRKEKYPAWKKNLLTRDGHLLNQDGNIFAALFLLRCSGVTEPQIEKIQMEWSKKDCGMRVNFSCAESLKLLDAANSTGLTDSQYIQKIIRQSKEE